MSLIQSPILLVAFAIVVGLAWLLRENERAYRARAEGRRDGAPYLSRLRRRRPAPVVPDTAAPAYDGRRRIPAGPIAVPVPTEKPTGTFAAGAEGEARVRAVLHASGLPAVEDFLIESGTGYSQIDHLVHAGSCLVVIETKNLAGTLHGAGRRERWVQSRAAYPERDFHSPLLQAEKQRTWLMALLTPTTRVEIEVLVVLAGSAGPPKDAAENVIALAGLSARLEALAGRKGGRDGADIAWAQIRHAISVTPQIQARLAHAIDHERRASWKKASARNDPRVAAPLPPPPEAGIRPELDQRVLGLRRLASGSR